MNSSAPSSTSENKISEVMARAPPPVHSSIFVAVTLAILLNSLPAWKDFDEAATVGAFTNVLFPEYISVLSLAWIRLGIAILIFATSLATIFGDGWIQETPYQPSSRLKATQFPMKGWETMLPFTSVSWNLVGLCFLINAVIAFQVDAIQRQSKILLMFAPDQWILRVALLLWEASAPYTILVTSVVRYVIWPAEIRFDNDTSVLKQTRLLLMHNANVLVVLIESALLSGLPVQWEHVGVAPVIGLAYVVFSWSIARHWTAKEHGPQFLYHFLDTTLPGYESTMALAALLLVLIVSFAVFCASEELLQIAGSSIYAHCGFVIVTSSLVMRFRD